MDVKDTVSEFQIHFLFLCSDARLDFKYFSVPSFLEGSVAKD